MNCIIRKGKTEDLSAVLDLIKELADYEKAPAEVTLTLEELQEDSFGAHPIFSFLVAESDEKIIGAAIFYFKYSTWKGKCLFLEDLIVSEPYRGKQVGKKLFEAVIQLSKKLKVKRMDWQVLDWNEPAINFYKKFDAVVDPSWVNCKLTESQLLSYLLD